MDIFYSNLRSGPVRFPREVTDIDGHVHDVVELSKEYTIVIITIKSTKCPVCPELLKLLNFLGLHDTPPSKFEDPFSFVTLTVPPHEVKSNRILLRLDAYFIIVCPGPVGEVRRLRQKCDFEAYPYPFIADEDMSLATQTGLRMSETEMIPVIAYVEPASHRIGQVQFGRSGGSYGHAELLIYLKRKRFMLENKARRAVKGAEEFILALERVRSAEKSKRMTRNEKRNSESSTQEAKPQLNMQSTRHDTKEFYAGSVSLPTELLFAVFDYLPMMEIVRSVIATCHQWRAIGFEMLSQKLRRHTNEVSEALSYHERQDLHVRSVRRTTVEANGSNSPDDVVNSTELDRRLSHLLDIIAAARQ
ncbi:10121_t:CDS:2, partial [Paraglomus occultum]